MSMNINLDNWFVVYIPLVYETSKGLKFNIIILRMFYHKISGVWCLMFCALNLNFLVTPIKKFVMITELMYLTNPCTRSCALSFFLDVF